MNRLPESELDIMLALWDADELPVSRAYFDQKLIQKNWTANALNSFLTRLEYKGFIRSIKQGKSKYYEAVVAREDYLTQEGKGILQKLYRDSLKNFILSVAEPNGLDSAEIEELQQYLNKLKEGRGDV